jgi:hypothetical protein
LLCSGDQAKDKGVAPDPKTLYAVTAFVFAALTVWLLAVLRSAREPWARPLTHPGPPGAQAVNDASLSGDTQTGEAIESSERSDAAKGVDEPSA